MRALDHPNICRYRGVCIAWPHFSLVYDFLDNGNLADRLRGRVRTHCQRQQNGQNMWAAASGLSPVTVHSNNQSNTNSNNFDERIGGGCGRDTSPFGSGVPSTAAQSKKLNPLTLRDVVRILADVADGVFYLHEVQFCTTYWLRVFLIQS